MPSAAPPSIGTRLRSARLDRSLSIEETAWRTRIRPDMLRALEQEEFETIGHQAFVRSHLASYARFLGIDPGEVVSAFELQHDEPPSALEELERRVRVSRKPPRPKWLIAALVSGTVLAAAGLAGILGGQAERPAPQTSALAPPTIALPPAGPADARVRLSIEATSATMLTVLIDGKQTFDGMLEPGAPRFFYGRRSVEVIAADGSVLRMRHNGRLLPTHEDGGTVYRQRFGANGPIDG